MKPGIFLSLLLIITIPFAYQGQAFARSESENFIHNGHNHIVYNGPQGGAFFLIRFFQIVMSPQDGPNCRHIPTCSAYGKDAVLKHGAFWGAILAGDRLLRCNPFYPPSKDPVPEKLLKND
ncbi:MAG TPA: membrane protein insertion efficiency factor YidD [Spirochaetota bacterium]|nr:membrane protein insertion efficiency factor YidD [Spirochaetota bacterium]HRS63004.1 membrane protein insertion efficiency factor YidD [Spirochaetota bacterium]HRU66106.1 membrane protein insertion efficiency factor YidD [Spirochaetota bacterium]